MTLDTLADRHGAMIQNKDYSLQKPVDRTVLLTAVAQALRR